MVYMLFAIWDKSICSQLNFLRFYLSLELREIHLKILIYLLNLFFIPLFSPFDFNSSGFCPLVLELLFQEFARLHIERYNFFRREL